MSLTPHLLLLSSSRIPSDPIRLHYAQPYIADFLRDRSDGILFVPYAGVMEHGAYAAIVRPTFESLGLKFHSLHEAADPIKTLREAPAICVGGGNTHLLNQTLHQRGLREIIREKVLEDGVPYLGWSAGANVAFGGIETTNDMNIVSNIEFEGLGLIEGGLRLNPHYADVINVSELSESVRRSAEALMSEAPAFARLIQHQGETREQRITEYLSLNPENTVIGLYEGGILSVMGDRMMLTGVAGAKVFKKEKEPSRHELGSDLSFLLGGH